MKTFLKNFIADESGASAAEYALILAVVGVAIGGAALLLSTEISGAITDSAGRVDACADAAGSETGDTACPPATSSLVD
ncbi:Flp family type IVb pilin [Pontixanthobacter gangjinensis]|uniref:Flp family type IVb pilin n=1 Tax=Pontixanthobacter gangjinensis TaxID=1028742 RepID=A0A6I4SKH1_9SPHN|nr:Flp family type IVb pilin [Pontixanthobacter gangjinensis]MXO55267.1 Flp family type IVb pilin [Pontixanthobacter gangjinensis]